MEDTNARKLSTGTQKGHLRACRRFAAFLKRSPDTASCEDIRRFQLHLAQSDVSISNRNRTMTGLRFLFRVTLRRLDLAADIYHIREPQKIPLAIGPDEAKRLLAMAKSLRVRLLLSLAYGCGLRAGEVVRLRAGDIARARQLLAMPPPVVDDDQTVDQASEPSGNTYPCPACGGPMVIVETFEPGATPPHPRQRAPPQRPSDIP